MKDKKVLHFLVYNLLQLQGQSNILSRNSGFALVSVIIALVIISLMAVFFTNFVSTEGSLAVDKFNGTQAYYLAQAGLEYEQRKLAEDTNWYRRSEDPLIRNLDVNVDAAKGSFTVKRYIPVTVLKRQIPNATSTNPIEVYTTNRFPASGHIMVEDDIEASAEFIRYTGISGNTFTGITRNVTIGGITGTADRHSRGERVYPVTTLVSDFSADCNNIPSPFQIAYNSKFLSAGTITVMHFNSSTGAVETEEISYSDSYKSGGNLVLTGVKRCQNGTGPITGSPGDPVTPILVDGTPPDYETEVVSTGTFGNSLIGSFNRNLYINVRR